MGQVENFGVLPGVVSLSEIKKYMKNVEGNFLLTAAVEEYKNAIFFSKLGIGCETFGMHICIENSEHCLAIIVMKLYAMNLSDFLQYGLSSKKFFP